MKKLIAVVAVLFGLLLFTGCQDMMNTPTKRVEEFLGKYQTMDSEVMKQLDETLDQDNDMTKDQRKDYRDLMKKQYQNLSYKIKDETVNGDDATVEVEVEVYDYHGAIEKAEDYLEDNQKEFLGDDNKIDRGKFTSYKIDQLKSVKEKIKYTLNITVHKKDNKWVMDDISETDREKLHGLYDY